MDNELRCKIMEIREETDCPINDIKEALEKCGLDKDKALECLREQARIKGAMTYEEAVKFCEETECENCPAHNNDKRTDIERYEIPCCENLVTERSE